MKTIAICLALAFSALALAQDNSRAANAMNDVANFLTDSKLDKVEAYMAENVSVFWIDDSVTGKKAVMKYLHGQLDGSKNHTFAFNPESGLEDDLISTSWGSFDIESDSAVGDVTNEITGHYTVVAKKVDGQWKIASLHLSAVHSLGS